MTYLQELQAYVGFGAADAASLARLHDAIADELGAVAEHFYAVLVGHPGAAAVLTEGNAQVHRLQHTLVEWMQSGLRGPHDEEYYERRSRIGRRHVAIGLPQQYMFTAMNVMRGDLQRLVSERGGDDEGERRAMHRAVDKLLDIELAIMLRHYQLEAEERLVRRERTAQLEKLTALQSLSAGLAHEVRNPLNAAKLQLELLQRRLKRADGADPRLVEATVLIHQEIGRLSGLLDEFLSFARPAELVAGRHDVVAVVRNVLELERVGAEVRGVELSVTGPLQLEADCDAGKLHQIVQNVVRNAVEASPDGGRVEVTVETRGGTIGIRVRDRGPGIPPEVAARMYEPFFSTKEGGTGMGMAIVQSLVALHGGRIEVRAPAGGGAEVAVLLPRR